MNDVTRERRRTWKWLLAAAAAALVLLFVVVLPAEYGYDPTRIGSALGLTQMSGKRVRNLLRSAAWNRPTHRVSRKPQHQCER